MINSIVGWSLKERTCQSNSGDSEKSPWRHQREKAESGPVLQNSGRIQKMAGLKKRGISGVSRGTVYASNAKAPNKGRGGRTEVKAFVRSLVLGGGLNRKKNGLQKGGMENLKGMIMKRGSIKPGRRLHRE